MNENENHVLSVCTIIYNCRSTYNSKLTSFSSCVIYNQQNFRRYMEFARSPFAKSEIKIAEDDRRNRKGRLARARIIYRFRFRKRLPGTPYANTGHDREGGIRAYRRTDEYIADHSLAIRRFHKSMLYICTCTRKK